MIQRIMLSRFLALTAGAAILALTSHGFPAKADTQACLQLVFASNSGTDDAQWHLFAINPDGSDQRQLTDGEVRDTYPMWSPDGKHIAFLRVAFIKGYASHIYVMNSNGLDVTQLTQSDTNEVSPAWSPDSRKIAFISLEGDKSAVYIMNKDGSERTHLLDLNVKVDRSVLRYDLASRPILAFAGDGHRLYFQYQGIQVIDIDRKEATTIQADGQDFEWSPDGKRIVYVGGREGTTDIYLMNADGRNIVQLTTAGQEGFPTWSPDGHVIAFTDNDERESDFLSSDVYLIGADGSHLTRLTFDHQDYWNPQWSPDGHQLIFWSNITRQTYIIDADGQRFHAITHLAPDESAQYFSWSPLLCP